MFHRIFQQTTFALAAFLLAAAGVSLTPALAAAENIAPKAKATAQNSYDRKYEPRFATDGVVPGALSKDDEKQAWCIQGEKQGFKSWFRLEWEQPQTIAEVVYFGRTAMSLDECFKDYELYLDDAPTPILRGTFQKKHGPQRVTLPAPKQAKSVTLKFLNAHTTTYNPGASEIAVYSEIPTDAELAALKAEKRTPREEQLATDVRQGKFGFNDLLLVERKHLEISHVYTYHVEGFKPGGGLCIFSPDENGGKITKILDAGDGMILDAKLHWNAKEIVFSWKKKGRYIQYAGSCPADESMHKNPEENYQIYTVNIDGTNLRQLTNAPYNNLNACWLPDGGIAFISDRKPAYAYCFVVTSPVLYRMERDGSKAKRLSANYLMDFTPSVLNDGRIIFTRWEYVDRCACPIQSLWTIYPDGTSLRGFFGNRILAPGTFMDANAIPNSHKILSLATNHNGSCVGGIVQIDTHFGANAKEGILNTTPEVDIFRRGWCWGNGLSGPYEKPFALDEKTYLVTKDGAVQIRTIDGARATLLAKNKQTKNGYYSVQPIREYPVPPVRTSSLVDMKAILPENGDASGSWGVFMMQDVYNGLTPAVKRGEVKRIAIVQEIEKPTHSPYQVPFAESKRGLLAISTFGHQFPIVSCGATYAAKKVWGYADVAPDGSASFQVPSEVPIYFLALDAEGRAIQRMRTFTHVMPGEVQGCVGCHADRNSQTPNEFRLASKRYKPQEIKKPTWGAKNFSYPEIVQPVLDKHCISCHNPVNKKANLDLSGDYTDFFSVSYDNLARKGTNGEKNWLDHDVPVDSRKEGTSPYTSWIWTINGAEWNTLEVEPRRWGSPVSALAEILRSGHPDKNGKARINVPQADREKIYMWIDLNVPYYPTSSSNHKDKLGSRRIYPDNLDAVLHDVSIRRCIECHGPNPPKEIGLRGEQPYLIRTKEKKLPREFYTRFMNPENNAFLLAPLAKSAGGTQKCAKAVFLSKDDPDYKKILDTFRASQELVKKRPRADMPAFVEPPSRVALQ